MFVFTHQVQSHILAEGNNDKFQDGVDWMEMAAKNSYFLRTSEPPLFCPYPQQVAGLLQDLSKQQECVFNFGERACCFI